MGAQNVKNPYFSNMTQKGFGHRLLIKNTSLLYSKTKTKVNSLLMKIKFINKGIEFIKLESILSNPNIINTLPNFCKFNKPTIIYKYLPPIRNKIFNYDKVIDNLHTFNDMILLVI